MRAFALAVTVSLLLSGVVLAQTQPASHPNISSPVMTTPATPPGPFTEPNLKKSAESGGKPASFLITSAPLPSDFTEGKKNAPIIMIEYASMSCPHCAHFSNTIMPELQKKYIDTGVVLYILRQFPLNEPAMKAAMLLDCVGQQNNDKYYLFAKVLFDAQNKWAFDANYMSGLETFATVGGLSKEQFQSCVNNPDRETKVLQARKQANDELKVPHTPYILIDGEDYEGDRSVEAISKFIDAKLAAKKHH